MDVISVAMVVVVTATVVVMAGVSMLSVAAGPLPRV